MPNTTNSPNILIVDDTPANLRLLDEMLSALGFRNRLVTSGRQALSAARRAVPDILLLDILMPGMDGYETIRAIREKPEYRRLPIVALTAKAMKGDRDKCLEAGASDYLAKPVNTEQLMSALRMWLHR